MFDLIASAMKFGISYNDMRFMNFTTLYNIVDALSPKISSEDYEEFT